MRDHPHVQHPSEYLVPVEGGMSRLNAWAVNHLAAVMGMVWTVWCFFIYPLILLLMPTSVRNFGFFLSSGWVQLWALPLFVYVGNRLQQSQNAQSDVQHVALTALANKLDEIERTVEANNKILVEIRSPGGKQCP